MEVPAFKGAVINKNSYSVRSRDSQRAEVRIPDMRPDDFPSSSVKYHALGRRLSIDFYGNAYW
jgi:hypothetical protein